MSGIAEITNKFEMVTINKENVGNEPLAKKVKDPKTSKDQASRGTPVQIATNMRKITIPKNKPIFKYAVKIAIVYKSTDGKEEISKEKSKSVGKGPEHERNKTTCSSVYKMAVKQCPELQKGGPFYYDRQASLYSLTRLKNDTLTVKVTGKGISEHPGFVRAEFTLTKVSESFQTTSNDISKAVNERPALADNTILEALSLIVSGAPLQDSNVLTIGNCVHYLYEDRKLREKIGQVKGEGGKESAIGACKSIKALEGREKDPTIYMATELKTTLFHPDNASLLDVLGAYQGFHKQLKSNSPWALNAQDKFAGLCCYLTYGRFKDLGDERIMIRIKGFGLSAREQIFDRDGKKTSVFDYFKDKYNIVLKNPDLFTILARGRDGKSQNVPVECLALCPSQPVKTEQMSKIEQANLIKLAAARPHDRKTVTDMVVESVGLGKDSQGIVEVSKPEVVTGYVLPKPTIKSGGRPVNWNDPNKRGPATDFNITKFSRPAQLTNWEVVFDRNVPLDSAIPPLMNTMREMGMRVENPQTTFINNGNLKPVFIEAAKAKRQLLLFITKSNNNYHQEMKCLEQEYDVVTQDIRFETALRIPQQANTRKNIVNKINIKLGGLNYEVDSSNIAGIERMLIIGFETSQKGGDGDAPIAVGFSANMSDHPMKFTGGYIIVKRTGDVYGPIVKTVVKTCLQEVVKNRQGKDNTPTRIVVYFSGVTEGQYGLINETYVDQIKEACIVTIKAKPHITVIAASKMHNTRLYMADQRGFSNLEPGTVIDETIVSPILHEWYGSSAVARQGTNKAAKYTIIFNTDKATPVTRWQGLTNDLCYDHQIVYHPVSYPAPLYVAGSYSNRGAQVLSQRRAVFTNGEFNFEATNAALGVLDKKLFGTRYNA